jgi:hypothetical protein
MNYKRERSLFIIGMKLWFRMAIVSLTGCMTFIIIAGLCSNPVTFVITVLLLYKAYNKGYLKTVIKFFRSVLCMKEESTSEAS